ncbi:MAG TPA: hypothetical protein DCY13_19765, partial [Verrucomicrobiales bacterium]|nr:hypothetical protein [Verrucomicrobiales bacterium]
MPKSENPPQGAQVPAGFRAVPVHSANADTPLRICVLAAEKPSTATGSFIRLRDTCDATALLGCLTDAAGAVHEWLELWLQDVDNLAASLPAARNSFSNRTLDERWQRQTEFITGTGPAGMYRTGWEEVHRPPLWINAAKGESKPGAAGTGPGWTLCTSDDELIQAGLPAYSESLHRYLIAKDDSGTAKFAPLTTGAPANDRCLELAKAFGEAGWVPFNLRCGLLRIVPFAPLELGEFADLLGGKPWKGFAVGNQTLQLDGAHHGLDDWQKIQQSGHHLFLGHKGRGGCILEAFHLKLQLLAEIIRLTRETVLPLQVPFLNIDASTFRVRLGRVGARLPLLWTSSVSVAKPGEAFALPVTGTEAQYFIRPGAVGESIFLPQGIHRFLEGTGNARLRKVTAERGRGVVEGTLAIEDQSGFSQHDLFWIRLPVGQGRVDLYAHCYAEDGLAKGEVRFRSVEQAFTEETLKTLKAAEGVAFPRTPYQMVPLLSTPCDLYSLGVLAARLLLVNDGNTLPVALDELLSFARQVGADAGSDKPVAERVRALLEKDARYPEAIG